MKSKRFISDSSKSVVMSKEDIALKSMENLELKIVDADKLDDDFMNELGYSMNQKSKYFEKIDIYKRRKLHYEVDLNFPPVLKESDFLGYNLVKYKNEFYSIPRNIGSVDLEKDTLSASILVEATPESLKITIQKELLND